VPGSDTPPSWLDGANCQRFAYGVLGLFGFELPPFRSSELWTDTTATVAVDDPRPLDLGLVNATDDPYGAHVVVSLGDDLVLHLCEEIGHPLVWPPGQDLRPPALRDARSLEAVPFETRPHAKRRDDTVTNDPQVAR
jgi:hypothetical protein